LSEIAPIPPRHGEGDHPKGGGGAGSELGTEGRLWKRIGWFVLLWAAGVAALAGIAGLLRWWIVP
jgi:hypothetical protein